jgi:hypothetical protein
MDALAKHIRERLELKNSCVVFETSLERVWPINASGDLKRKERIQAFAKDNGWSATINDPGIRVTFRKLAAVP